MKRRAVLTTMTAVPALACLGWAPALASADVATLLRAGGCVLMLRHAKTEAGIGDPPGFTLDNCSTQRNLSSEGRAQARRIGAWFQAQGLRPRAVQSSVWCRCVDTATLAFGQPQLLAALNSTFGTSGRQAAQTRSLKTLLANIPVGQFELWVTHQVNMTDLCEAYPGLGEGFVVSPSGSLLARHVFA